ncbi:MAG: hypothetical protein M1838_005569 [Thelocarpon superellum]|nr:MAG: hypothetical protein M1838_005569 [Thelocarpon superellum]
MSMTAVVKTKPVEVQEYQHSWMSSGLYISRPPSPRLLLTLAVPEVRERQSSSLQYPPLIRSGMPRRRTSRDSEDPATEASPDERTSIVKQGKQPLYGGSDTASQRSDTASQRSKAAAQPEPDPPRSADGVTPNDPALESRWKRFIDKYGSIELDNKGSVARDHLALERTFLAWLRTSLAFASIGIAITQLFRLNTTITNRDPAVDASSIRMRGVGKPLGSTFLAIAIIVLFVGFHRYFESQHWIIRGKFPASRGSVFIVAMIAGVLIVGSLVVILAVDPSAIEK